MKLYGPMKLAYILFQNRILSPIHSYILRKYKQASISYQSSVLYDLLQTDFEDIDRYMKFKYFMKKEQSLRHLHSKIWYIGKIKSNRLQVIKTLIDQCTVHVLQHSSIFAVVECNITRNVFCKHKCQVS